jgi:hypothetical protein
MRIRGLNERARFSDSRPVRGRASWSRIALADSAWRLAAAAWIAAGTALGAPPASPAPPGGPTAAPAAEDDLGSPYAAAPALTDDTRGAAARAHAEALAARKLGASEPLTRERLRGELTRAEQKVAAGRIDEAIGDLVHLVEAPRFDPFRTLEEGRAARHLLGDLLGRAGVVEPARGYLLGVMREASGDVWYRQAARTLVDLGLESDRPEVFLADLAGVPRSAPEELRGDIAYLEGRMHQRAGRPAQALAALARVTPRSRFWAQAIYLAGLLEVERGRLKTAEKLFCRVADARRTPREALLLGGAEFFRVRDLSRLALGRVAHEQYRFDDARYYYYLVPADSEALPEALYEAATGRYEAKDYAGARDLVDQLRASGVEHPYQDELWVFDAYLDLATCRFPEADEKLRRFLRRYEPVRAAARSLVRDERARLALLEATRAGTDPATAGLGVSGEVARALGALLRVDDAYVRTARRLDRIDHQLSGLRRAAAELEDTERRLARAEEVRPRAERAPGSTGREALERARAQLGEIRRLLREAHRTGKRGSADVQQLERELASLEVRVRALETATAAPARVPDGNRGSLEQLVAADRARAAELERAGTATRRELVVEQIRIAREALERLDRRLSRLIRRARLGRIETVLGKKRALEVEIEALAQGYLPRDAVDSLDAARYLRDDEEYWPDDGEDWADEYVGGEGLR